MKHANIKFFLVKVAEQALRLSLVETTSSETKFRKGDLVLVACRKGDVIRRYISVSECLSPKEETLVALAHYQRLEFYRGNVRGYITPEILGIVEDKPGSKEPKVLFAKKF